ncbi:MAG TPA: hypothetical protein VLQ66_00520 [Paenisporosarcina sp.]|nr:hypothetical protein [Paenisporosarcina sp.]
MHAPKEILDVWEIFNDKPMDTLMKLWWSKQSDGGSQRSVSLIKEHFVQYGVAGNCVDLSLWLIEELRDAGIEAYGIIDDVCAERAHIAVVAVDRKGLCYLCDLGDQWIQPISIEGDVMNGHDFTDGFFPAAKVKVLTEGYKTTISYQRPNGKASQATYHTTPLDDNLLWTIAERVQRVFRKTPLVEIRLPIEDEIAHWEFDNWTSFLSTSQKLHVEESNLNLEQWVERINMRTGMKKEFLQEALKYYKNIDA